MSDKDVAGTLRPLVPFARPLVLTRPYTARALSLQALADAARHLHADAPRLEPDPRAALDLAWSIAPFVCVAGSIFLVGDLLGGFPPK
jgi:folylpolyglutamate synthase/dihydropteroate synthase